MPLTAAGLVLVAAVAMLGFIIYLVVKQQRVTNAFFSQLGALGSAGAGRGRYIPFGGYEVGVDFYPGSKNNPSRFSLILPITAAGSFQVEREGASDRFLESLGLEGKIATNEPEFDERFHVVSDEEAFAAAYFADAKKREAVKGLFEAGCKRVELGGAGLKAVWTPFKIEENTKADFVRDSLPLLAALAQALPSNVPMSMPSGLSREQFGRLFSGGLVLLMAAFIFLPVLARQRGCNVLEGQNAFLHTARLSLAGLALFLMGVLSLTRGKSWFSRALIQSLALGAVFFPFSGYWTYILLNCGLDRAEPAPHPAPIISKYKTHDKHGYHYKLVVQSWRPGRAEEQLATSRDAYDGVMPGRTYAVVETKPGYLGLEWLVRYRVYQPDAAGYSR